MTDLHWQTITPEMRQVMTVFAQSAIGERFYLAGGTALALQLGHRRSADLDYFSQTEDVPALIELLKQSLISCEPELADSSWGNLVFLARGVRLGFYGDGYELLQPLVEAGETRMASVTDIALMKLDTLLGRAGRKDFHDLYAICQTRALRELLDMGLRKYPDVRDFEVQVVKRLTYFEAAEQDAPPLLLEPVAWETVKEYFRKQAALIGRAWIGEG